MSFTFEMLEDKVEFFEAGDLASLERKLVNKSIIIKHLCLKFITSHIKWLWILKAKDHIIAQLFILN